MLLVAMSNPGDVLARDQNAPRRIGISLPLPHCLFTLPSLLPHHCPPLAATRRTAYSLPQCFPFIALHCLFTALKTRPRQVYCRAAADPAASFAGRWAAKEAIVKAISNSSTDTKNLWVRPPPTSRPPNEHCRPLLVKRMSRLACQRDTAVCTACPCRTESGCVGSAEGRGGRAERGRDPGIPERSAGGHPDRPREGTRNRTPPAAALLLRRLYCLRRVLRRILCRRRPPPAARRRRRPPPSPLPAAVAAARRRCRRPPPPPLLAAAAFSSAAFTSATPRRELTRSSLSSVVLAQSVFEALGLKQIKISISHSDDYAVAQVRPLPSRPHPPRPCPCPRPCDAAASGTDTCSAGDSQAIAQ